MSEVKTETDVIYYVYAKKQIRLLEYNETSSYWDKSKTHKTLKVDEFVAIKNPVRKSWWLVFNVDGIEPLLTIENNNTCYEIYKTLDEVLAKQEKEKSKDKSKYVT